MLKQLERLERDGTDPVKLKSLQDRYERRVKKCIKKPCWVKAEDIGYLLGGNTVVDCEDFENYTPSFKKKKLAAFVKKQKLCSKTSASRKPENSAGKLSVDSPKVQVTQMEKQTPISAHEDREQDKKTNTLIKKKKKRKDSSKK